ncbi:MAG TPA: hypothetical protein VMT17_18575 [Anaeromyxobacteraceae bacterium]|nr:hypothetical protein [Anaeromyxobacteraceae bacterium]
MLSQNLLSFPSRAGGPAGDPTAFLCPVCFSPLYGSRGIEPLPCRHVLLAQSRDEDVYWRDNTIRALSRLARQVAAARGANPIDVLREYVGRELVVYELIERPSEPRGSVAFVVEFPGTSGHGWQQAA